MRNRVSGLLRTDFPSAYHRAPSASPFISTFHSLGVSILREHAALAGLPRRFVIFDRDESKRAVKKATEAAGFDPKNFEPGKICAVISREKGEGRTRTDYGAAGQNEYFPRVVSAIWNEYEKVLREEKALDFDDLLLTTMLLLQKEDTVRTHYQRWWRYLHIDEYQDTNRVQYEIARLLAAVHKNIAVVGDIDQNIYTWRGASIKHLLHFERDWPNAKTILLEENYRSTQNILSAANEIIKKNRHRLEKNLFTRAEGGEKIAVYGAYDEASEAEWIADSARALIAEGVSAREIAVLFRANFQSRALEEAFFNSDIT
jgi:DNA helicase-2/ATP-dependent DNA helicase PcrA